MSRIILIMAAIAIAVSTGGCGIGGSISRWEPVTVSLRERDSGSPVAATVQVRPLWLFASQVSRDPLNANASDGRIGSTGSDGQGEIEMPVGVGFDVRVLIPWDEPHRATLSRHPSERPDLANTWIALEGGSEPVLELRLTPIR